MMQNSKIVWINFLCNCVTIAKGNILWHQLFERAGAMISHQEHFMNPFTKISQTELFGPSPIFSFLQNILFYFSRIETRDAKYHMRIIM